MRTSPLLLTCGAHPSIDSIGMSPLENGIELLCFEMGRGETMMEAESLFKYDDAKMRGNFPMKLIT